MCADGSKFCAALLFKELNFEITICSITEEIIMSSVSVLGPTELTGNFIEATKKYILQYHDVQFKTVETYEYLSHQTVPLTPVPYVSVVLLP
jgi:hypothetical protein